MSHPDVLVVGAGAAGLFCALGLAGRARVSVIEGGADPGSPPPARFLHDYLFPPEMDWGYRDADTGQELLRGRVVGGSSSTNSSAALRGRPWCYDDWGLPAWSWERCLPAFRAIERDVQFGGAAYHGDAGPIPITRLAPGPIDDAFTAACCAAGHHAVADHNAPEAMGIGPWPTNRVDGGRWGTLAGVAPLLRGTVELVPETIALRLVVSAGRVTGVETVGVGGARVLSAPRVILAGGAYGTPELLLRSGIGPADVLAAAGIAPVADLSGVGANLQDHPWVLLDVPATDPEAPRARPVSGALLRLALGGEPREEAQVFPFRSRPYVPSAPPDQVSFAAALMAPRSRGRLDLGPAGEPRIRLRHLAETSDADRLAAATRAAADLVDALAAEGVVSVPDDAWWRADDLGPELRRRVMTYNHPVGTCRMGPDPDDGAVVDGGLRVHGVDGLMVADASVMPVIPRANTNLPSMMIGARAAELAGVP